MGKYVSRYVRKANRGERGQHVFEHRLAIDCAPNEVVHHIDGDPKNNRADNLVALTRSEHMRLHWLTDDEARHKIANALIARARARSVRRRAQDQRSVRRRAILAYASTHGQAAAARTFRITRQRVSQLVQGSRL